MTTERLSFYSQKIKEKIKYKSISLQSKKLLSSQLVTEKIFKGHWFRPQTATIGGLHLCPCFMNIINFNIV